MTNNLDAKKKDLFENQPVLKAIFSLAIPSIIGQLILVIYNMTDTFFIGMAARQMADQGLGNALVAGVTICMPVYMILSAISNLFGVGASSVISRSLGKNNPWRAKNASRFAFYACLATSMFYCLLVLAINPLLANLLSGNKSPETAAFARQYISYCVVIFGIPTAINTLFSHLLRAQGQSMQASFGIVLGGVLNCALDPLFMFVLMPEQPAVAAALATGISNFIALVYYMVYMLAKRRTLVISIKPSRKIFSENIPGEVIRVGTPACLMTLFENVSYMILDALVGSVIVEKAASDAALAGIGVAKKVNMFAHCAVRGMTQGVLPIIGYNKTSGNRKRMANIVYASGAISVSIALICMVVSLVWAQPLSEIFIHEESSIARSTEFLRILCIGAPFSAVAYTVISFFQAVGKAWRSLILAMLRKGILDIPLMLAFFSVAVGTGDAQGPELIVWATPVADITCCLAALILLFAYLKRNCQTNQTGLPAKEMVAETKRDSCDVADFRTNERARTIIVVYFAHHPFSGISHRFSFEGFSLRIDTLVTSKDPFEGRGYCEATFIAKRKGPDFAPLIERLGGDGFCERLYLMDYRKGDWHDLSAYGISPRGDE